jgi:hypothetical protein
MFKAQLKQAEQCNARKGNDVRALQARSAEEGRQASRLGTLEALLSSATHELEDSRVFNFITMF